MIGERTIEIKIIDTELLERLVEFRLRHRRLMGRVPQFGGHEELLPFHDGGNNFFERGADLVLVLVDHSEIEVAISIPDGIFDLS